MNASSESGLWATVISRTAADTDEDDIAKSYNTLCLIAYRQKCWFRTIFSNLEQTLRLLHRLLLWNFQRRSVWDIMTVTQMPTQPPSHGDHRHHNGPRGEHQQNQCSLHQPVRLGYRSCSAPMPENALKLPRGTA